MAQKRPLPNPGNTAVNEGEKAAYIGALREFSDGATMPSTLFLPPCTQINDVPRFWETHVSIVETHWGKPVASPYLRRLLAVKDLINGKADV